MNKKMQCKWTELTGCGHWHSLLFVSFDSFLTSVDSQIGPDFKYLNPEGVIPPECLITTKYTGTRAEQEEAKQLEDE